MLRNSVPWPGSIISPPVRSMSRATDSTYLYHHPLCNNHRTHTTDPILLLPMFQKKWKISSCSSHDKTFPWGGLSAKQVLAMQKAKKQEIFSLVSTVVRNWSDRTPEQNYTKNSNLACQSGLPANQYMLLHHQSYIYRMFFDLKNFFTLWVYTDINRN